MTHGQPVGPASHMHASALWGGNCLGSCRLKAMQLLVLDDMGHVPHSDPVTSEVISIAVE